MTHQGAACDLASIHFGQTIRTDKLVYTAQLQCTNRRNANIRQTNLRFNSLFVTHIIKTKQRCHLATIGTSDSLVIADSVGLTLQVFVDWYDYCRVHRATSVNQIFSFPPAVDQTDGDSLQPGEVIGVDVTGQSSQIPLRHQTSSPSPSSVLSSGHTERCLFCLSS